MRKERLEDVPRWSADRYGAPLAGGGAESQLTPVGRRSQEKARLPMGRT